MTSIPVSIVANRDICRRPRRRRRLRVAAALGLLAVAAALAAPPQPSRAATLANPAATYCVDHGGRAAVEHDGSGAQFGVCLFDDNRQCEQWALLRGDCPAGGIKVTGYVTPAARYCALRGGRYQVLSPGNRAAEQGSCGFGNGRSCAAGAFFAGLCSPAGAGDVLHALFRCDAGRTVDAVFDNGAQSSVSLALSDGRTLVLPRALSASGARYADAGESVVFWNKGDTAFIDDDGRRSYRNCRIDRRSP